MLLHWFFSHSYYSNAFKREEKDAVTTQRNLSIPNRSSWCSGIFHAFTMSDDDYLRHAGVDALSFVEYLRLSFRVLASCMIWGVIAELACYTVASQNSFESGRDVPPGFLARASLANIGAVPSSGSWDELGDEAQAFALALSLIGIYLNTFYALSQLGNSWKRVSGWAHKYLEDPDNPTSHAVLVQSTQPLSKPISQVTAFKTWDSVYPGEVISVRMIRDTGKLPALLSKFDKVENQRAEAAEVEPE